MARPGIPVPGGPLDKEEFGTRRMIAENDGDRGAIQARSRNPFRLEALESSSYLLDTFHGPSIARENSPMESPLQAHRGPEKVREYRGRFGPNQVACPACRKDAT